MVYFLRISDEFNKHFGKYGDITDSVIMKDRLTGHPRGFGFITFADPVVVDKVIEDTHVFSGKQVETKSSCYMRLRLLGLRIYCS